MAFETKTAAKVLLFFQTHAVLPKNVPLKIVNSLKISKLHFNNSTLPTKHGSTRPKMWNKLCIFAVSICWKIDKLCF